MHSDITLLHSTLPFELPSNYLWTTFDPFWPLWNTFKLPPTSNSSSSIPSINLILINDDSVLSSHWIHWFPSLAYSTTDFPVWSPRFTPNPLGGSSKVFYCPPVDRHQFAIDLRQQTLLLDLRRFTLNPLLIFHEWFHPLSSNLRRPTCLKRWSFHLQWSLH